MPTTITHSIGSGGGRDYSTLQAWEDACPVDLTAVDEIWRGEAYNDSDFLSTVGNLLTVAGTTTDATRYLHLTAATGESFQDNANVRTNRLYVTSLQGVALEVTTTYSGHVIDNSTDYFHLSRVQMKASTRGTPLICSGHPGTVIDSVLCVNTQRPIGFAEIGTGAFVTNCIVYIDTSDNTGSGNDWPIGGSYGCTIIGCAVVRNPAYTAAGTGMTASSACLVKSSAIFGFTTPINNADSNCTNNATDQASLPGSGGQTSVTFTATTPFVEADSGGGGGLDLRAVAATALAANGFLDSTNAPNDISKTARANPPTIGAWELLAGLTPLPCVVQDLPPPSPRRIAGYW